jgi:hypothetical protein
MLLDPRETIPYADLYIPQASTFSYTIDLNGGPNSLAGYGGKMQIRTSRTGTLLHEVNVGDFSFDESNRRVTVRIPGTETAAYSWDNAFYDIVIDGPEGAWRIAEGRVYVTKATTRED